MLPVIEAASLRPTPSRIRETLFNWLMHDIRGATCLDAFAGSGALSVEALSRGATSIVLLEKDPHIYAQLTQNLKPFLQHGLSLIQDDAIHYLEKHTAQFDIVFLDPPFNSDLLSHCLQSLASRPILKSQGLVYIESASPVSLDPLHWICLHDKKAGQVYYGLYQKVI